MVLLAVTGIIQIIQTMERIYSDILRCLMALSSNTILFQNFTYLYDFVSEKINEVIILRTKCIGKANKDTDTLFS